MIIDFNPMPTLEQTCARIPKKMVWKKLRLILRELDFYDVLVHDDGNRITANLYATVNASLLVSMKNSVTIHVMFIRESRSVVKSTGMLVLLNGKRGKGIDFPSPRDAITAALNLLENVRKSCDPRSRGDENINAMEWDDDQF